MVGPFGEAQRNLMKFSRNISRAAYLNSLVEEIQQLENLINDPEVSKSEIELAKSMLEQLDKQLYRILKIPDKKGVNNEDNYKKEI